MIGIVLAPHRCAHPNLWNSRICYITLQKDFTDIIKVIDLKIRVLWIIQVGLKESQVIKNNNFLHLYEEERKRREKGFKVLLLALR